MNIKYVFSDIDGTLTGNDHILTSRNIVTIKKIRDMGIGFCLQTGRLPCSIKEIVEDLGMDKQDDSYIIGSNGALIANTNSFVVNEKCLSINSLNKCLDYFSSFENKVRFLVTKDHYYAYGNLGYSNHNRYSDDIFVHISLSEAYELIKTQKIYKMALISEDKKEMDETANQIKELTKGEVVGVKTADYCVDFFRSDASKGSALLEFCKYKNIDPKNCLVIGDSYNDINMYEVAGHKACPKNAIDEIKKISNYVSQYDAYNSAVADILEKMVINK